MSDLQEKARKMGFTVLEEDLKESRRMVRNAVAEFYRYAEDDSKGKADMVSIGKVVISLFSELEDMQLKYNNEVIMLMKAFKAALEGRKTTEN